MISEVFASIKLQKAQASRRDKSVCISINMEPTQLERSRDRRDRGRACRKQRVRAAARRVPSRVAVSTRHRLSPNECRSGCCGPPPSRASGVPPGTPHEQVGKIGRRVLTTQAQGNAKKNGSGSGNKNLLHSRRA